MPPLHERITKIARSVHASIFRFCKTRIILPCRSIVREKAGAFASADFLIQGSGPYVQGVIISQRDNFRHGQRPASARTWEQVKQRTRLR